MRPQKIIHAFAAICNCSRGTALIETAIIAPVLILLAFGSYDVSQMVARQAELQSGALQGQEIALAASMGAKTDTVELKSMLESSLGLNPGQVAVAKFWRCDDDETLVTDSTVCGEDAIVSSYIQISLQDEYTPLWLKLGIGKSLEYNVVRMVQLS